MKDFQDLEPQKDPKGGSPRTPPRGIPVRSYMEETPAPTIITNGHGSIWRAIAMGQGGLLVGLLIAWFTAFTGKGVTHREMEDYVNTNDARIEKEILAEIPKYITRAEMEEYVKSYSPWVFDKQAYITRMAQQDEKIGELRGKIDLAAKYIEQQNVKK